MRSAELPEPALTAFSHESMGLSKERKERNNIDQKKTIVFDLDETLVHRLSNPELRDAQGSADLNFRLKRSTTVPLPQDVHVNFRPFARECLEVANEFYEVIVFTAGIREYADPVLDSLDPTGCLIQHRFYREHCCRVQSAGEHIYVKDLRVLGGRNLKDILIVDNSLQSFAFQLNNGVPIADFTIDKNDRELLTLARYIRRVAQYDDVR